MIELRNLNKTYGKNVVLHDMNLSINSGEFVMLSGNSGAGKTTLLDLISGLEKPTSGEIVVDGKEIGGMSAREQVEFYRHMIGMVFQSMYLQPDLSLLENIALPGMFAGLSLEERNGRARELAEMLGIVGNLNFLPKEVSGGQAARACIARALLLKPMMILADEPTSNLDEENAWNVLKILEMVRRTLGVTIIVASHDHNVKNFATQMITLVDGNVNSELINHDDVERNM